MTRGSAEAVVVIGTSTVGPGEEGFDGTVHWSVFAPGATTAGWTGDARSHPGLRSLDRVRVSFGVRRGPHDWQLELQPSSGAARRVRWDTGSLSFQQTGR